MWAQAGLVTVDEKVGYLAAPLAAQLAWKRLSHRFLLIFS